MERINLNVPPGVRGKLRSVARRLGKTESEVARELLIEALARAERDEILRRTVAAQTPAMRERQLAILDALERLGG